MAAYAAIMLLAGLIHGTLGLGFPLVATPLLALFTDVRTAILITLLPTASVNVVSILKGGRWSESIGRFWPLAVFAVLGSIAGTRFLVVSDPAPFKLLLAALVLLYLFASQVKAFRMRWVSKHLKLSMVMFGLTAGLAAGTTNVMVPILIIYTLELGLERTAMVQVFNLCFLAGGRAVWGHDADPPYSNRNLQKYRASGAVTTGAAAHYPVLYSALRVLPVATRSRERRMSSRAAAMYTR